MAIGEIISTYKFRKQDRKNREEFIDWLMCHFDDPNYKVFDSILSNDKFRYAGNDGKVYSLYKLNDSLCDCVRKRGEEEWFAIRFQLNR